MKDVTVVFHIFSFILPNSLIDILPKGFVFCESVDLTTIEFDRFLVAGSVYGAL